LRPLFMQTLIGVLVTGLVLAASTAVSTVLAARTRGAAVGG